MDDQNQNPGMGNPTGGTDPMTPPTGDMGTPTAPTGGDAPQTPPPAGGDMPGAPTGGTDPMGGAMPTPPSGGEMPGQAPASDDQNNPTGGQPGGNM